MRLVIGDISKPEHRVLRLGNFHFDATDTDLREFFEGYDLVDWKRDTNVKSGKKTIAYVLMGSMLEVIRAEEELDAKELNGRSVRLMRAKSGFTLTKEGLLNDLKRKGYSGVGPGFGPRVKAEENPTTALSVPADEVEVPDVEINVQPAIDPARAPTSTLTRLPAQLELQLPTQEGHMMLDDAPIPLPESSHTSVTIRGAAYPSIATPMVLASPISRKKLHHSTEPCNRVLLINGLHHEANVISVKLFFANYTVVDFMPRQNAKTGRQMGFGFVMLASLEERNLALQELQGRSLMGKVVRLEIASKAVKVTEEGFLNEELGHARKRLSMRGKECGMNVPPTNSNLVKWAEATVVPTNPTKAATAKQTEGNHDTLCTTALIDNTSRQEDLAEPSNLSWPSNGWDGLSSFPNGHTPPTWNINVAHRALKPWSLRGNKIEVGTANMVTEEDWYYFQPKEVAKYEGRKLDLD
jgi:RNA recognition motif-containing protein